ncbi:MAG: OadG family protein [Clostridia bacterium]|nr:OadG family protein [Clostridia bacterium]
MNTTAPLPFTDSLLVMLIGMAIVFGGLAVLIGLIKLLIGITDRFGGKKKKQQPKAPVAAPARIPAQVPVPQPDVPQQDDSELVAVITAAIACMLDDNQKFIVRRVRRISI